MDFIQCKYFKIVATGGDLDAATEMPLATDKVNLIATPEIIDHITTASPFAAYRIEIGTGFQVKGVLADADLDTFVQFLGGQHNASVYTKTQGVRTLPEYDIRLGVYRPSDGAVVPWTITEVNFVAPLDMGFEQKKKAYLPFDAMGTDGSDLTIDNS